MVTRTPKPFYAIVSDALRYRRLAVSGRSYKTRSRNKKRLEETLDVMTDSALEEYFVLMDMEDSSIFI
jgi:hypothetical protein